MANEGVYGQEQLNTDDGGFNALSFLVNQLIGKVNVATLVKVVAVNSLGRLASTGTVDVLPLVNMRAGDGTAVPHTTIHNVPYLRIQGGANAVMVDPHVGDIGFAVFADQDISMAQASHGQASAGSRRRFSMADALYFGGWSNTTPVNLVLIDDAGIKVDAPSCPVEVTGQTITLNGPTTINGTCHITGAVTMDTTLTVTGLTTLNGSLAANGSANTFSGSFSSTQDGTFAGTHTHTHVHSGVTAGGANTGAPV